MGKPSQTIIPSEEWTFFRWACNPERTSNEISECWRHELTRELISREMPVPEIWKVILFGGKLPQRAFLDSDDPPQRDGPVNREFTCRMDLFSDIHPARLAVPGRESGCNFPLNIDWNAKTDEIIDRVKFLLRLSKAVNKANPCKGKHGKRVMLGDLKNLAADRLMRSGMKAHDAQDYAVENIGDPIHPDLSDWRKAGGKTRKLLAAISKTEDHDLLKQFRYLYDTPMDEFWGDYQMIEIPIPPEK
jgi:hypothetical protein